MDVTVKSAFRERLDVALRRLETHGNDRLAHELLGAYRSLDAHRLDCFDEAIIDLVTLAEKTADCHEQFRAEIDDSRKAREEANRESAYRQRFGRERDHDREPIAA